mmetsp:Transcript_10237/g.31418  ORF Transcript_10237/g.31418 Transcript_10237/m.31418 type:complete len:225 (+) Transcript_10237:1446-2120(+)|eukprot:scaffold198868_cov32-Tisochrysis_lutea.AAC.2
MYIDGCQSKERGTGYRARLPLLTILHAWSMQDAVRQVGDQRPCKGHVRLVRDRMRIPHRISCQLGTRGPVCGHKYECLLDETHKMVHVLPSRVLAERGPYHSSWPAIKQVQVVTTLLAGCHCSQDVGFCHVEKCLAAARVATASSAKLDGWTIERCQLTNLSISNVRAIVPQHIEGDSGSAEPGRSTKNSLGSRLVVTAAAFPIAIDLNDGDTCRMPERRQPSH